MKHKNIDHQFKILNYLLLLPITFLLAAIIWSMKIDGNLYVCNDTLPILNFIPPFVHGSMFGDYYLTAKGHVYSTWAMFIAFAFITPLYLLAAVGKDKKLFVKSLILSVLAIIIFVGYGFSQFSSLPPAPPTPLDVPNAEYTIVKLGENYAVSFNQDEDIMYIGTSKVDLAPFINQSVRLTGSYTGDAHPTNAGMCQLTKEQCIVGQCHQIFENGWEVCKLDIETVEVE
ncbi:hypothetical protein KBC70_01940 [Candidatus Woesebacteria bacterium]|nr:hypothetical protein [Candidatus Woesebacteria bacterium]